MTSDRRHPYIKFNQNLIADFLNGRQMRSAELIAHGKSHTNYRLALSDGTRCVLRLHPAATAERERNVVELAADVVPVPAVLGGGPDWTVFSLVEGEHLADYPQYTRKAAAMMARIWSVRFESAGWIKPDGSVEPFDFGDGNGFFSAMLNNSDVQAWLDEEAIEALAEIIEQNQQTDSAEEFCLVHGDFNPTNILIKDGEVAAILDWEFAHANEPFMDISNLVRHTPPTLHSEIKAGLEAAGKELPENWLERCEFDHLGSYLEFLTTQRSDDFKRTCIDWISGFIERRRL